MLKILGLSASLRNARRSQGNTELITDLTNINSESELFSYLEQQASQHLTNFLEAGRGKKLPFDVLYKNIRSMKGNKGLSNSEVALASALWSAHQLNAKISHYSLGEFFSERGTVLDTTILKQAILEADGILVSTPVYFGDRASLVQSLIDMLHSDIDLKKQLKSKVFAGIAVGAKRNGGQETTLIYQLWDAINLGFLGVGNDSESTAQYGGTGLAGDIGSMPTDHYGLKTSMGTGRRVTHVARLLQLSKKHNLKDKIKILFWIMQDKNNFAVNLIKNLINEHTSIIDSTVMEISSGDVSRCIACDICPISIDTDDVYRCIIGTKRDFLKTHHQDFLDCDVIIPIAYSANNYTDLISNYQQFMERTRYLRRGDYILSDIITAPLCIEELGATDNMSLRMMTSLLRHHTILSKPLTMYIKNDVILNQETLEPWFSSLIESAQAVTVGRIVNNMDEMNNRKYNPVGYVLSAEKDKEDEQLKIRRKAIEHRFNEAQASLDRIK